MVISIALFPINTCHQRVVTHWLIVCKVHVWQWFPINRCHQRVVTKCHYGSYDFGSHGFPINRCQQRVVTILSIKVSECQESLGFQSIGVTSEW